MMFYEMLHKNYTTEGVQQMNCVCSSTITGRRTNIDRSHHHFSKVYHSKSVAVLPIHMAVLMLLFPFFVLSNATTLNVVRQLRFGSDPVPETTVARAGQTLTLNCEVNGSPAPEVYWIKNGIPVPETMSNQVSSYSVVMVATTVGRLTINCVANDSEAVYTCVAQHGEATTIMSHTILVIDRTIDPVSNCNSVEDFDNGLHIGGRSHAFSVPAYVTMWMSHTAAQSGEDVVLYCRGYGTPPLQIEWLNPQGNEIVPFTDGKHQINSKGDLKIRDLTWNDRGNYMCRVKNHNGSQNVTSFLYPLAL